MKAQPDKGGPTESLEDFFRKCPQCGQRFHVKLEGKKLVSVDVLKEDLPVGPYSPSRRRAPIVPVTLDVEEFRYNYKCNRCGHEWSEGRLEESREG